MTKPTESKEHIYRRNIQRSLQEMYAHMEKVGKCIPEDIDEDELNPQQRKAIEIITAIEEEWIVDPADRAKLSMIQWDEDEDGPDNWSHD